MNLIVNSGHPPFTPEITVQRAVEFNLEDKLPGVPHKSMPAMFAALLEELVESDVLGTKELGRVLNLEIASIHES